MSRLGRYLVNTAGKSSSSAGLAATDYDRAYSGAVEHPRSHNLPVQFGDEHALERTMPAAPARGILIRRQRLYISSVSGNGNPESFRISIPGIRRVRYIKVLNVFVRWTPDAGVTAYTGFVLLEGLKNQESLASGKGKYHAYFPITQGTNGTALNFNVNYAEPCIIEMNPIANIPDNLTIKTFYENTNGDLAAFTILDRIALEIEIGYIDGHGADLETSLVGV